LDLQEVGGGCGDWMELAQDKMKLLYISKASDKHNILSVTDPINTVRSV
jgi:hypothetical protein